MGTSKPYSAPATPQWTQLKKFVTDVTRAGAVSGEDAQKVIKKFADAWSSMRPGAQGGLAGAGGGVAAPACSSGPVFTVLEWHRFVREVHEHGFATAVVPFLVNVPGRHARRDLILALLNGLGPDGCTLVDVDIRFALLRVLDLGRPTDSAQVYGDVFLAATGPQRLEQQIQEFFGAYLEHAIHRSLYEHLTEKVGHNEAIAALKTTTEALWRSIRGFPLPQAPVDGWDSLTGQQSMTQYLTRLTQHLGTGTAR